MARQAGVFNACCRVLAPWFRQASFRAFADRNTGGEDAYDLAYGDVLRAFDHYMAHDNHGRPFMLVGHSQGALHVLRLLRERIDGMPAAAHMVAAYAIGLGISEGDFGTTYKHLQPCRGSIETGCVISWASFLEGSETASYIARNEAKYRKRHDGGDPKLLCVNPLTFDATQPSAGKDLNPGTLPIGAGLTPPVVAGAVGARCENGVLLVTPPPAALGLDPIPGGGNMHYHDIALFYAAIRTNAVARADAFLKGHR
jgi:pimeloyl-ACP methyl ester carboxylesterase